MNKGVSFRRRLLKTAGSKQGIRAICFSTLNPNEQQTVRCDFATTISNINLQYSTNGVDFQTYTDGQEITFGGENKVWFRGKNNRFATNDTVSSVYTNFKLLDNNVLTRCDGNIMHLLDYEQDLNSLEDLAYSYIFCKLFYSCTALYSCPDILVETIKEKLCFAHTFEDCINLKYIPKITTKNFGEDSFSNIFKNCTNLEGEINFVINEISGISTFNSAFYGTKIRKANIVIKENDIKAKCFRNTFYGCTLLEEVNINGNLNLGNNAASNCFDGCSNLETFNADSNYTLNINSVDVESLKQTFHNCTKLETININLNAEILFNSSYYEMFKGCSSITISPSINAIKVDHMSCQGMFTNCINLINAPELKSRVLARSCYYEMFLGCSNLQYIKCDAIDISEEMCLKNWVKSVSSSGTFVRINGSNYTTGDNGIPNGWTVEIDTSQNFSFFIKKRKICSEKYNAIFEIKSTGSWEITYYPNWVRLNKLSGAGNDELEIEYIDDQNGKIKQDNIVIKNLTNNELFLDNIYGLNTVKQELTFIIKNSGYLYWKSMNSNVRRTIEYTKDKGINWTSITSAESSGTEIEVFSGDIISFRGNNSEYGTDNNVYSGFVNDKVEFDVCGNIMSLINSTNFDNLSVLTSNFTFHAMFKGNSGLKDASNLSLPATTLTQSCYRGMFDSCRKLLYPPELLASQLVQDCYRYMFSSCSSLIYIKCLCDTNINNATYTQNWVQNVKNTNECKFVKKSTTQIYRNNMNGIPSNWVIENV